MIEKIDAAVQKPFDRIMWHLEQSWTPPAILKEVMHVEAISAFMLLATAFLYGSWLSCAMIAGGIGFIAKTFWRKWKRFDVDARSEYDEKMANRYAVAALMYREGGEASRVGFLMMAIAFVGMAGYSIFSGLDAGRSTHSFTGALVMVVFTVGRYLESAVPSPPKSKGRKPVLAGAKG